MSLLLFLYLELLLGRSSNAKLLTYRGDRRERGGGDRGDRSERGDRGDRGDRGERGERKYDGERRGG